MKGLIIIGFLFLFSTNQIFGQFLQEQEWAKLSNYISSNDQIGFKTYLKNKGFLKANEPSEKYNFYTWNTTEKLIYAIRVNKKSGQVTYMTNDQNYVLKLLSRFMSDYTLVKSEKQSKSTTHIFQSLDGTIAVKLDTASDSGTHLLFAIIDS
ncbi:hypothetical protein U6A24_21035 [Aquimarina gracilis]|uniref:Uncharacterized protein n=1 Tax=Aquimarina gracilis TaxID=874422 RepID=A0ABU6A1L6_9FLAO|nr:hypothetical protein [Aquimarina gracilis]MEB3347973.1 hypothetical protein [Aquimarina gracilis]